jgi:hypothetical protein
MKTKTSPKKSNRLTITLFAALVLSTTCFSQPGSVDKELMRINPLAAEEFNLTEPVYLVENSERRTVSTQLQRKHHIPVVKVAYIRTRKAAVWNKISRYSAYKPLSRHHKGGKLIVTPYVMESTHDFVEL